MSDVRGDYIECTEYAWDKDGNQLELTYRVYGVVEFPRGKDGRCAFCQGDPCAERGEGLIALYCEGNSYFETCPVCSGRPA